MIKTIVIFLLFVGLAFGAASEIGTVPVADINEIGTVPIENVAEFGTVEVASCTTVSDSETGAQDGNSNIAVSIGSEAFAAQFVTTSAYTVCQAGLYMKKGGSGSPTQILQVAIYTNSTDEPGTLVGTASDTRDSSTFSASETEEIFTGLSATLSNATTYWIVVLSDSNDAVNYPEWFFDNTTPTTKRTEDSTNPITTWNNRDAGTYSMKYRLYSQ